MNDLILFNVHTINNIRYTSTSNKQSPYQMCWTLKMLGKKIIWQILIQMSTDIVHICPKNICPKNLLFSYFWFALLYSPLFLVLILNFVLKFFIPQFIYRVGKSFILMAILSSIWYLQTQFALELLLTHLSMFTMYS